MAKFINKKVQVFDLQLTTYGRRMFSVGSFRPTYYTFFDDNVVYDSRYISLTGSAQNSINERVKILDGDIAKITEQMQSLDKQKTDAIAMLNALNGAKQQCMSFLNDLNNGDQPSGQGSDDS